MVEAILTDHKRPPDLFFVMVISDDAHRMLLCDLREIADKGGTLDHLLRRAVTSEDRVLVKREKGLERCAPECLELYPELLKKIDGDARTLPFLWFLLPGFCRFATDNIDGLNHSRIEILLDTDRDIERSTHAAFVFADRAPGDPEHLPHVTKRHAPPFAETPGGRCH